MANNTYCETLCELQKTKNDAAQLKPMPMSPNYLHIETKTSQCSKWQGQPCGDMVRCDRTAAHTTLMCVDGIGSGTRARIAAQMCATRLATNLQLNMTLRQAFTTVSETMNRWRDPSQPFAAFSVARIRNDGTATTLCYDAPPPILLGTSHAAQLPTRPLPWGKVLVTETQCQLKPGEGLLLMSDGITQAGIGTRFPTGWGSEGVTRFASGSLVLGRSVKKIPELVLAEARRLWGTNGDDCTAALAYCRPGNVVSLFTGPPASEQEDGEAVRRFMDMSGEKVVCGGTTADVVASWLGSQVEVEQEITTTWAPPRYGISGIDVVTEGAVTLNQVCNLLDLDMKVMREDSGVADLYNLLKSADCVHILHGTARNQVADSVTFRQQGILARHNVVPLLVEKLRNQGKLVTLSRC